MWSHLVRLQIEAVHVIENLSSVWSIVAYSGVTHSSRRNTNRTFFLLRCNTYPERVIGESIISRNVIINRGAAEVDNHISRDDIFDYHPLRECNIYFIIPNRTLDSLFFTVCFLLDLP